MAHPEMLFIRKSDGVEVGRVAPNGTGHVLLTRQDNGSSYWVSEAGFRAKYVPAAATGRQIGARAAQLFSGGLRPFPGIPQEWPSRKQARANSVLEAVRLALPGHDFVPIPGADVENFWEDACRIAAAYRASDGAVEVVTGKLDWTSDELARRLGPVSWDELVGGRHALDALIAHPIVAEYGGRAMQLVTLSSEDQEPHEPDTIVDWIVDRHRAGVKQVVVKNTQNKSGIWVIPTAGDREHVRSAVWRELEWTGVSLDGLRGALLAQDMIDLQFELRCFAVDGAVVTAAGNIEEFTPLDRNPDSEPIDGVLLDTRLRQYRGHLTDAGPSEVTDQPAVAIRLMQFAQQVAAEHGGTVDIDVALNASTGSPVVVELNELPNSGLFATDPDAVTERLMVAQDRGYQLPV